MEADKKAADAKEAKAKEEKLLAEEKANEEALAKKKVSSSCSSRFESIESWVNTNSSRRSLMLSSRRLQQRRRLPRLLQRRKPLLLRPPSKCQHRRLFRPQFLCLLRPQFLHRFQYLQQQQSHPEVLGLSLVLNLEAGSFLRKK